MSFQDILKWLETVKAFLKRFDTGLLLFSAVTFSVVAIFEKQYWYWPPVILVLAVVCLVCLIAAVVFSFRHPVLGLWKEYFLYSAGSLVLLIWLGSDLWFYAYPLVLFVILLLFALQKGGSPNATS